MDDVLIDLPSVSRVAREGSLEILRKELCRSARDGAHQLVLGAFVAGTCPRQYPGGGHFAAQILSRIREYRDLDPNAQTLVRVIELFDADGEKVAFELPLRDDDAGAIQGLVGGRELVLPALLQLAADGVAHHLIDLARGTNGVVGNMRNGHVILGARGERRRGGRLALASPEGVESSGDLDFCARARLMERVVLQALDRRGTREAAKGHGCSLPHDVARIIERPTEGVQRSVVIRCAKRESRVGPHSEVVLLTGRRRIRQAIGEKLDSPIGPCGRRPEKDSRHCKSADPPAALRSSRKHASFQNTMTVKEAMRLGSLAVGAGLAAAFAIGAPSVASASPPSAGEGERPHVQVRGVARIDAHEARLSGKLVISGTVTDDLGARVAGAAVMLKVTGVVNRDSIVLEPCGSAIAPIAFAAQGEATLATDSQSASCVRLSLPVGARIAIAHLEVRPSAFLEGTAVDLPLDPNRKPVTLRFDPEPSRLDLDGDMTSPDVVATTENDGEVSAAPGLLLEWSNEAQRALGSATTLASGHAHVQISSAELGPAGRGELRVQFGGSEDSAASTHVAFVERRTTVHLEGLDSDRVARATVSAERVRVDVRAVAACAVRGCAASPTGSVEMVLGDKLIGASAIRDGTARLSASLPTSDGTDAEGDVPFRLRYVPDAPWFVPSYDVFLPRAPPAASVWGEVVAALAGLAAAGWVVASRWPDPRRPPEPPVKGGSKPRPRAGVTILSGASRGHALAGRVLDAHEGTPIGGARIRLLRPGFEGVDMLAYANCDAKGSFELSMTDARPGDELVVDSDLHRALRTASPAPGTIEVSLVLRRRQLLEDLVGWARRRGGRFDARPDPTPAHVRQAAHGESQVASWAEAVERAAYGSEIVDVQVEMSVNRLAPAPTAAPAPPAVAALGVRVDGERGGTRRGT